jgi:hypothetical protein
MRVLHRLLMTVVGWTPAMVLAAEPVSQVQRHAGDVGISGIWLLANLCFAGMRAQNSASVAWRIIAFIFGFPGTLITFLVVTEGSERAYGVDIPKKRP